MTYDAIDLPGSVCIAMGRVPLLREFACMRCVYLLGAGGGGGEGGEGGSLRVGVYATW